MSLCLVPRSAIPPQPVVRIGPARFNHVECAPAPALAPFVDHYWVSRWDRRGAPPRDAASLLDPCVHLQVENGDARLMGVLRSAYRIRIEGEGSIVGVKFRPGGFHPFVNRDVSAWTDRVVAVNDVLPATSGDRVTWASELTTAIVECIGDGAAHAALAAAHLDAFLAARLPARDATAEHVAELVALIAGNAHLRRIGDLVEASGRSERTLHRLFGRYVGASPSWVIRRYRLKAAAQQLTATPPADVRTLAWDTGYADQAHFIRDFRATVGMTPGEYVHARTLR